MIQFFRRYDIPWVTALFTAACVIVFVGIHLEPNLYTWHTFEKWGVPSASGIWNGQWIGLFTSAFVHIEIWHIAFNLIWFWKFGRKIEFTSSPLFLVFLVVSGAIISSTGQLAISGVTGIGLSGVVYALFGFLFIRGQFDEEYEGFVDQSTVQYFIIWLFLCIALTYAKIWQVGNAAHIAGTLWGMAIGHLSKYSKRVQAVVTVVLLCVFLIPLFWAPWSTVWLGNKAFAAHQQGRYQEAWQYYNKILAIDPTNGWAKENMNLLPLGMVN